MRIIGIESSAMTASVAIVTDSVVTAEYTTNFKQTHSQTLLPMIDEICRRTETPIDTVDCIAISSGPGSFTGLRIGSATGKGLGLALDKPVASVPTLEALAYNMAGMNGLVCPIMDARRNNLYNALYRIDADEIHCESDESLLAIDELLEKLNSYNERIIMTGDGVLMHADKIAQKLTVPYVIAPAHMALPRAASVAVLGMKYFKEGRTVNAREHVPDYLRPSQAEREHSGV